MRNLKYISAILAVWVLLIGSALACDNKLINTNDDDAIDAVHIH
jgi:hypothetical protein